MSGRFSAPVSVGRSVVLGAVLGAVASLAAATSVAAHGAVSLEPPSVASLLIGWTFEPLPTFGIAIAAGWWWWAVRRVNAAHPDHRVPVRRSVAFAGGLTAIAFALLSGIDRYTPTLFSVHMVQHVLLTLVAAPLIALSAPITLVMRLASAETRRRWILPVLHSRVVRVLAFPVVAWLVFAGVMWVSHFSPLFDAALENPWVHDLEHALFLGAALLFWWPAVALDPAPWRMPHPARALYVFLQMPQNTFLAVVLLNLGTVLYPHYASLVRTWGPSPLDDQRLAAGIMWIAGDTIFLSAILAIVFGWMRAEARDTGRSDRRAAVELGEIRVRERLLAERLAREREDGQSGSGASR